MSLNQPTCLSNVGEWEVLAKDLQKWILKNAYESCCISTSMSNFDAENFQKLMVSTRKEINESLRRHNNKSKYELYVPAIQDNPEITVMILRATKESLGSGMLYNIVNSALLNYMPTNFHLESDAVDDEYAFTQDDSKA